MKKIVGLVIAMVPDFAIVGVDFNGIAIIGAGTGYELNWVTRGPEVSWKPIITTTASIGIGYSIDATVNIGGMTYLGPVNGIRRRMLQTNFAKGDLPTIWEGVGLCI